jgi:hypothetical protein
MLGLTVALSKTGVGLVSYQNVAMLGYAHSLFHSQCPKTLEVSGSIHYSAASTTKYLITRTVFIAHFPFLRLQPPKLVASSVFRTLTITTLKPLSLTSFHLDLSYQTVRYYIALRFALQNTFPAALLSTPSSNAT